MTETHWSSLFALVGALLMAWPALRSVLLLRKIPPNMSPPVKQNGKPDSPWESTKSKLVARYNELAQQWHGYLFWMFLSGLFLTIASSVLNFYITWNQNP